MKLTMSANVYATSGDASTSESATAEFDIISDAELNTALKQWDKVTNKLGLEEENK